MVDPEKFHRRSIRLAGYDYSAEGAYFVTLCATEKRAVFGAVQGNTVRLSAYGEMAKSCWQAMPEHFSYVTLDEFIVMPNHFHAILVCDDLRRTKKIIAPTSSNPGPVNVPPRSLGALVRSFKSAVTREANVYRQNRELAPVRVWQRNYYEHIIRNERELDGIRRYIAENPEHWLADENNPRNNL